MLWYFLEWSVINEHVSVMEFHLKFLSNTRFLFACGSKHFYGHGSQFYDHLETLLLNLHNVLLTKKLNLFFKQFGSQPSLIFRCKSKQDNNN